MLSREQCLALHEKNGNKRVWLEWLAANDHRLVLRNDEETLHFWSMSEVDQEEQAQAARLCAAINYVAKMKQAEKEEAEKEKEK